MRRIEFLQLLSKSLIFTGLKINPKKAIQIKPASPWPVSSYPNLPPVMANITPTQITYTPVGIGGGGAYAGYAISPYNNLRLVGTDMGTLFRSPDDTKSWYPISHYQAQFNSKLELKSPISFSPDGIVILYSEGGSNLLRSCDQGITFQSISFNFQSGELIQYFSIDSFCASLIFMGTNKDLYLSEDQGKTWSSAGVTYVGSSYATGTLIDYADVNDASRTVYHATSDQIYKCREGGSWQSLGLTAKTIRAFTGGRDKNGLTLAFAETDAYTDPNDPKTNMAVHDLAETIRQNDDDGGIPNGTIDYQTFFGYLNVSVHGQPFKRLSNMGAGCQLCMAENDSLTIYTTGGSIIQGPNTQQGSKVWKTTDAGGTWRLIFLECNQAYNYRPWPAMALSAPGIDIGWLDDSFHSFAVNPRNCNEIGGTNNFFLLTATDGGQNWLAPFTQYAGNSHPPTIYDPWKSTGMENTSVLKFKFHPDYPNLAYGAVSDIAGLVTTDGGKTFRITKTYVKSTQYDYAFLPGNSSFILAVSGNIHDFWQNSPDFLYKDGSISGGVFVSNNQGKNWTRLTPFEDRSDGRSIYPADFNMQFVSLAYDPVNHYIYAGSQGNGVAFSNNDGAVGSWMYISNGLPNQNPGSATASPQLIIPQIEIDPVTKNIYCLVSGNSPAFTNFNDTGIYIMQFADLKKDPSTAAWTKLGNPNPAQDGGIKWYYPIGFAIDWTDPAKNTFWLIDIDRKQPGQFLNTGIWLCTDGQTWAFNQPHSTPSSILIDTSNKQGKRIYVNGLWEVTPGKTPHQGGSSGYGGPFHSDDNGRTWYKNVKLPLLHNGQSVVPDPNDPTSVFYTFFGGGLLHGPRPDSASCDPVVIA